MARLRNAAVVVAAMAAMAAVNDIRDARRKSRVSSSGRSAGRRSKYMPHQGARECARRVRQMAARTA